MFERQLVDIITKGSIFLDIEEDSSGDYEKRLRRFLGVNGNVREYDYRRFEYARVAWQH